MERKQENKEKRKRKQPVDTDSSDSSDSSAEDTVKPKKKKGGKKTLSLMKELASSLERLQRKVDSLEEKKVPRR